MYLIPLISLKKNLYQVGYCGPTIMPLRNEYAVYVGFPQWLSSKESACNVGDAGDMGSILGSGRSSGGGNGNPLQYSCLENCMEPGGLQSMGLQRVGHDRAAEHTCTGTQAQIMV